MPKRKRPASSSTTATPASSSTTATPGASSSTTATPGTSSSTTATPASGTSSSTTATPGASSSTTATPASGTSSSTTPAPAVSPSSTSSSKSGDEPWFCSVPGCTRSFKSERGLKSHVTKIHTKSSSTAGEAQSTPSAASSSSKEWDCFVGQHGSRWTWSEDYPLIKLTHQYKGHWGKVLTEFHAKKIGGENFVHNEDQLRRRYETVTKTSGTLWRDIVVPTFRVPTGTEDVENKKEEHLKKPIVDSSVTTSKAIDNHIQTADKHRKIQRQENRTQWQQACLLEIKGRQTQIVHYHLMHLLLQRSAETEEALVEHLTGKRVIHPNEDEYRATLEHYAKLMKEACGELANEVETQNDKGKEKADQEKELESNDPYSVPPPSTEENDIALCRSYWGLSLRLYDRKYGINFPKWFLQMVQNEQAMETTPGNEGREGEEEDEDDTPTIQDMETLN